MKKKCLIAGMLVVVMTAGGVMTSGNIAYAAAASAKEKEEVVYVMTTAEGEVDSVNVVNIFGKGAVTDYGSYSEVKMLNSTADIHQSKDQVTFTTDQDKVYYQGTLKNAQIPWDIKFTYTLDGKKLTASEVAGKSGALQIHIQITENKKCKTGFYDNYALQAALSLDTGSCKNIRAEGATLANVGASKQISYTVLPGKGLDAVVYADVTDFEMDAVSINGVRLDLDIDLDDEELMDKVNEIMDASRDLNDGAIKVSDGADELRDGGSSLTDGASSLNDGVVALDEGIRNLKSGAADLQTALNTLNDQSGTLRDGSGKLLEGLQSVQSRLSGVSVSTDQLGELTGSSAAIRNGIHSAYEGAAALQAGISYDGYKAVMAENSLDLDALQSGNAQTAEVMQNQIADLSNSMEQLKSDPDYDSNQTSQAMVANMEQQIASLTQAIQLLQGNNAAIGGMSQYLDAVSQSSTGLVSGLSELESKYGQFDSAINGLANTLSGLSGSMTELKNGIDQLASADQSLDNGIRAYTDGVSAIVNAYSQFVTGTDSLAEGSGELLKGSDSLKQGTQELYDGILTLNDGTKELSNGTNEFYEQTDGMDEKISTTIDDTISSISGGDGPTVSFVSDRNKKVASVQFVIKTAAIEKPEVEVTQTENTEKKSFWQKLIGLFR